MPERVLQGRAAVRFKANEIVRIRSLEANDV